MKILILGAYGMLGHKMFQVLCKTFDVYATCRSFRTEWTHLLPEERLIANVHAENFNSILKAFAHVQPDVVINCIGIVKQLDAARDPIPSIEINALLPHKLNLLCQARGARLFHFSTDCVFSGEKGNYTREDFSDARDLYGKSKYLGEIGEKGSLTIRSSIIGRELGTPTGLVEWFLGQKGNNVKGFSKAIYTGFTTLVMANLVGDLIAHHPDLSGVWQVASQPITKYDLLNLINDKMQLNIEIEKDEDFMCDRSLSGDLFSRKTGIVPPSWNDMIDDLASEGDYYEKN